MVETYLFDIERAKGKSRAQSGNELNGPAPHVCEQSQK
jgi:hypothetical protein